MHLFSILARAALALQIAAHAADPHSCAQPDRVRVTPLDLDFALAPSRSGHDLSHRR
jgi:leukotriene-A4 hydrolase